MKIDNPKIRNKEKLTMQELGLLTHIQNNLDSDGLFDQHLSTTGDAFDKPNSNATIHRTTRALIKKSYLVVIRKSRQGDDGWMIPPILKPTPISPVKQDAEKSSPISPVKNIENKQSPISSGMLEASLACKSLRMSVSTSSNASRQAYVGVKQDCLSSTQCAYLGCTELVDPADPNQKRHCYRHCGDSGNVQPNLDGRDGQRV